MRGIDFGLKDSGLCSKVIKITEEGIEDILRFLDQVPLFISFI